MTKNHYYYKLNKPVYDGSDVLRVGYRYQKGVGYVANIAPVSVDNGNGLVSVSFSAGYFKHQPIDVPIIPCSRRNTKKLEEGLKTFQSNVHSYAEKYMEVYKLSERGVVLDPLPLEL